MPKLDPSLAGFTTNDVSRGVMSFSPDKKGIGVGVLEFFLF